MKETQDGSRAAEIAVSPGAARTVRSFAQAAANGTVEGKLLAEGARQMLRARLQLKKLFPSQLFHDSAWDMMLELFISAEEGGILFVKQLIIASGESAAAAMRRIDRLEDGGFMIRQPDPLDHRRVIVTISEQGRAAMVAMMSHLFQKSEAPAGPPVAFNPRR